MFRLHSYFTFVVSFPNDLVLFPAFISNKKEECYNLIPNRNLEIMTCMQNFLLKTVNESNLPKVRNEMWIAQ